MSEDVLLTWVKTWLGLHPQAIDYFLESGSGIMGNHSTGRNKITLKGEYVIDRARTMFLSLVLASEVFGIHVAPSEGGLFTPLKVVHKHS